MDEEHQSNTAIPILEERTSVGKRRVQTGRVRVRIDTEVEDVPVTADLTSEAIDITHVPIGREISETPAIRSEGEVTIIPVVEEILVVEKRLVLREEIHLRRISSSETSSATVSVRRQTASVEREEIPAETDDPSQQGELL